MSTVVPDDGCNPAGRSFFHQENGAASTSGATSFSRFASVSGGHCDQFVDQRGRDAGCISTAQLPLFPQKPGYVFPVATSQRVVHGASNLRNAFEVAEYVPIAIDVGFEHFPIVDS